jgi:non-reducing end alpha-L-arabinofuranosidase
MVRVTALLLYALSAFPVITVATGVCDIYASGGTPCVAAHSLTRALFAAYDGPLFTVSRNSDGTSRDIGVQTPGGVADTAAAETFCGTAFCTVERIFDQSTQQK